MKGAFQISREIFENPIWNDIPKFRIFFYILGQAVFSEEGIRKAGIHIKRGQYLRSYRNLRDDLEYIENRKIKNYSISVISRKIDQLVKEERLKIEDTELGTLFTVVNYDEYQCLDNYKNELGTESEQSWNNDGTELEQYRNNNKNVKNDKNVKKKEYTSKIKDLLPVFSSIENFNELSKRYWDAIRETRKSKEVQESVIYKNMNAWTKYDPVVIEYSLKAHIKEHLGKREEYTLGIMRRTSKEDAHYRLNAMTNSKPSKTGVDWDSLMKEAENE